MPLTDEEAAVQAISTFYGSPLSQDQESAKASIQAIIHGEGAEPFVDIHELFSLYDVLYFRNVLLPRVEVLWSARLTLCAGICELTKDIAGKYRRIRLKLSESLLKFRPREDTINTLLHEAIHAYFFITSSWRHSRDNDGTGHGVGFQLLANAINNHGPYEITVFHSFHDEVDSYRTHVWQCDGPCRQSPPYFGLVKRSMNRPPGKNDTWWGKHQNDCGGVYVKVAEPELTKQQLKNLSSKARAGRQKNKLDRWVAPKSPDVSDPGKEGTIETLPTSSRSAAAVMVDDANLKRRKGIAEDARTRESSSPDLIAQKVKQQKHEAGVTPASNLGKVGCPICGLCVPEENINEHLDELHPF